MRSTKTWRTIDEISGSGRVLRKDRSYLSDVAYTITVQQEFLNTGREEIPMKKRFLSYMTVINGEKDLMGSRDSLLLMLEGGGEIKFAAIKGDIVSGDYTLAILEGGELITRE